MTVKHEPITQRLAADVGDTEFIRGLDKALSNVIAAAMKTDTNIDWRTLRIESDGQIEVRNGYGDIEIFDRGLVLSVDTIWIEDDE